MYLFFALIIDYVCRAIEEGAQERKMDKDSRAAEQNEEENESMATERFDDEDAEEQDGNKIRKVKGSTEDNMEKRPRKQIAKRNVSKK